MLERFRETASPQGFGYSIVDICRYPVFAASYWRTPLGLVAGVFLGEVRA